MDFRTEEIWVVTSCPFKIAVPIVGWMSPHSIPIVVVLPEIKVSVGIIE